MVEKTLSCILVGFLLLLPGKDFKEDQKRYSRVRTAYSEKEQIVKTILEKNTIRISELQVYIRAFKMEKELELWGKNEGESKFKLIKTYEICRTSGTVGPKRKQGDLQIPEGFYHIDRFNPSSNFYLSLGINYPNKSDRVLGDKTNPGGDIFIHGACVTIGCIPLTDDIIKELYVFCVEAKNNGQNKIPMAIFPTKLTDANLHWLKSKYHNNQEKLNLWTDIKKGFDHFEYSKTLPSYSVQANGRYLVH